MSPFASAATRRAYRVDLRYWFAFCRRHRLHPYRGIRRTHLELYLRELEQLVPKPANTTRYRRIATLSAWFAWLEDEDLLVGSAAARVRRPIRHRRASHAARRAAAMSAVLSKVTRPSARTWSANAPAIAAYTCSLRSAACSAIKSAMLISTSLAHST